MWRKFLGGLAQWLEDVFLFFQSQFLRFQRQSDTTNVQMACSEQDMRFEFRESMKVLRDEMREAFADLSSQLEGMEERISSKLAEVGQEVVANISARIAESEANLMILGQKPVG